MQVPNTDSSAHSLYQQQWNDYYGGKDNQWNNNGWSDYDYAAYYNSSEGAAAAAAYYHSYYHGYYDKASGVPPPPAPSSNDASHQHSLPVPQPPSQPPSSSPWPVEENSTKRIHRPPSPPGKIDARQWTDSMPMGGVPDTVLDDVGYPTKTPDDPALLFEKIGQVGEGNYG